MFVPIQISIMQLHRYSNKQYCYYKPQRHTCLIQKCHAPSLPQDYLNVRGHVWGDVRLAKEPVGG